MADVYSTIADVTREKQLQLAEVIEMRAADPRHQAMLRSYLSAVEFPKDSNVLEIGCGTGAITRVLAEWPAVHKAVGIDPSPVFIERARELGARITNLSFTQGDGRSLPFDSDNFDVVVVHTTLSHVPDPDVLIRQAWRVLKQNGWLAVFDGDYATATVGINPFDPLEVCVDAFRTNFVHDPWLVRRLSWIISEQAFSISSIKSFSYIEAPEAGYMLSWIDRGAEVLLNTGCISTDTFHALKAEARRRSESQRWYGFIAFASVIAKKSVL